MTGAPTAATSRPTATRTAPDRITAAAPQRSISGPLAGSAMTEPAEIASRSRPS